MKLWGSVKQQAEKLAFEAEKAVRIKREESAIANLKSQIEAQYTELGKTVLRLMAEGAVSHPQLEPFAQAVASLQEQIKQVEQKLAEIRAEEFSSAEEPPSSTPDMTQSSE